MGPATPAVRTISQQAFDEMVQENIEDLGMDPTEALDDAIQTLTLQGVDLSGIVTSVPGESNPVIECLGKLKEETASQRSTELLEELSVLCGDKGLGNAAIATRNGGVELVISLCSKLSYERDHRGLVSGLNALALLIHDLQSSEIFRENSGPKIIVGILINERQDVNILDSCFQIVAAAASGNEVLKESFMDLRIDELITQTLKEQSGGSIPSIYDAIRIILTSDDNRVLASNVFGYARKFAKLGIAEILVDSLGGLSSPSLISASIALRAVAVNDEICRAIANNGGIDVVLRCIDDSGLQGNYAVARACLSLLSKLAGSDANKNAIVEKGGMDRLISLTARCSDDPLVLQEVMSVVCILCLRSPENAARAIESGAGDFAIQAMQKFPQSDQLQKNSCFMIRNLVARNVENRKILLSNGIEELIRRAKGSHKSCKAAATDALRDLGLDNYNS
ncbi:hypothetical protein ACJIZ3_015466 [Penstemon smallii]|uniref:Armadillo repeat-containing protein 6 n=1 Tax=Penstemon smallii TaxID=265156 RepID=A0ABD3RMU0_9LAMI